MRTLDFYYADGTRHTITFDGVYTLALSEIIKDTYLEGCERDRRAIVIVVYRTDTGVSIYNAHGQYVCPFDETFAGIASELTRLYLPYTRAETVQEAKEAAGI